MTTTTITTSGDDREITDMEITRQNALDVQIALDRQQRQLRADLATTTDPAQRADLFGRAATNQERQALAWERRPGRARFTQPHATECRWEARLCTVAAQIEQRRARAAERGHALPDPHVLLAGIRDDDGLQALVALYTEADQTRDTDGRPQAGEGSA